MRIAIIALQGGLSAEKPTDWHMSEELEVEQALALASYMRDGDKLEPLLVCQAHGVLESRAKAENLPCMALGRFARPWHLWKLWQWQKQQPNLTVLAIGESGISLGRQLWQIHGRQRTRIYFSFFFKAPKDEKKYSFLDGSTGCFCGSEIIRAKMEKIAPFVDFYKVIPPGIDLENYVDMEADLSGFDKKSRFVFGMAESLQPKSGALLVVRAMAAMWQQDGLAPWEVRMFGGGPRFEEILKEAINLGVSSRLSILGDQPLAQAAPLCNAWLAPGEREHEPPQDLWAGFGAALPVICSRTPFHRERLQVRNCALRVDGSNPQELARAMIALMRDARLRDRLLAASAQMRPLVSSRHMAERMCVYLEKFADRKPKKMRGIK